MSTARAAGTLLSIFRMSRSLYLKIHFVLLFRERKRKVYISKTNDLLPFILLLQVKRNSKISKAINSSIMIEENSVKLLNRKF
jgi:penicillin-binding protein-related factor A (putative recombinase)